jgi:hypothetical protein
VTYYPPQQPGPQGPWGPEQGSQQQPPTYDYPAYEVPPPAYGQHPYGGVPSGYGAIPPGYPYPYAPQPPKKSNTTWWILGGVASVLVIAALVVGGIFLFRSGDDILVSTDEAQIEQLVEDFGAAGNSGNFSELGQYFCAAEAGMFSALGELGQILQGIEMPGVPTSEVTASDIEVKGEVASARMSDAGPFDIAYFRKEAGEWKVCMSAAVEFSQR